MATTTTSATRTGTGATTFCSLRITVLLVSMRGCGRRGKLGDNDLAHYKEARQCMGVVRGNLPAFTCAQFRQQPEIPIRRPNCSEVLISFY